MLFPRPPEDGFRVILANDPDINRNYVILTEVLGEILYNMLW
jgi:Zn-dependent protease